MTTNKTKKDSSPKNRVIIYTNQLHYIKEKEIPTEPDEFQEYVEKKLDAEQYAFIIHDRDISKKEPTKTVEPHYHLVLRFENPRSLNAVAKDFGDDMQHFEVSTGRNGFNNQLSYLVHETDNSTDKVLYDPSEVIANFDYPETLKKIEDAVSRRQKLTVDQALEKFANRELTFEELKEKIGRLEIGKNQTLIERLIAIHELENYDTFVKEKELINKPLTMIWVSGDASGVGKTSFSKDYAKNVLHTKYYSAKTSTDTFDQIDSSYNCLIFEEFEPGSLPIRDLLILLDPYQFDKRVSARYRNRSLCVDTMIINSRFTPDQFWGRIEDENKGSSVQFYRRFTKIYHFTEHDFTRYYFENLTYKQVENLKYEEILNSDEVNLQKAIIEQRRLTEDTKTYIPVLKSSNIHRPNIYVQDNYSASLFDRQKQNLDEDLSSLKGFTEPQELKDLDETSFVTEVSE